MNKIFTIVLALIVLIIIATFSVIYFPDRKNSHSKDPEKIILEYGDVTLKLNQLGTFRDISIRPFTVDEDSRCPEDVQCIWAGTVHLLAEIVANGVSSTATLVLGETLTTNDKSITLKSVSPTTNSQVTIENSDYSFVLSVSPFVAPPVEVPVNVPPKESSTSPNNPTSNAKCYIGGCSRQVCSSNPNLATTCEYKEEYACYKTATCKRQPNGKCGWTNTSELSACLSKNTKEVYILE